MTRVAPRARRFVVLSAAFAASLATGPSHESPRSPRLARIESDAIRALKADAVRNTASVRRAQADGDVQSEAEARLALGRAHFSLAQLHEARVSLTEALTLYRTLNDPQGEATALDVRGTVALTMADAQEARSDLTRALMLRRGAGDRAGEAQTRSNLGLLHASMDETEAALDQHEQAWQLFKSLGDHASEATVLHNLAEFYLRLGDGGRALQYGRMALELHRIYGPASGVAHTLEHIGSAYQLLGEAQEAARHYERALEASRTLSSRWIEAGILARLGAMQRESGAMDAAALTLSAALNAWRTTGNRIGQASTLSELARVRAAQGRTLEAAPLLHEALAISQAVESAGVELQALAGLADLARVRGDLTEARRRSEAALALVEGLRAGTARDDVRIALSAVHDHHYRRHVDILMALDHSTGDRGHAAEAFGTAERARARTLLDLLARANGVLVGGVPPELAERERRLRWEIGAKGDRLSHLLALGSTQAQVVTLRREIDALVSAFHDTRVRIRLATPAYAALVDPEPISLARVQRDLLDRDTVLLQYSLGDSRSFVWAIAKDGWTVSALPGRMEIEGLIRRALQLLTARSTDSNPPGRESTAERIARADDEWASLGRLLSGVLLGPVASHLGYARIAVVGDGPLDHLPFSALPDPTSAHHAPLVTGHEIVRLPSASTLHFLRQRRDGSGTLRSVAILADPVFDADDPRVRSADASPQPAGEPLRRLRFSRTEATSIAALAPESSVTLLLDFAASRNALLNGQATRHDILHLATHGTLDTEQPELSALVLSTVDAEGHPIDGRLRLADVYSLRIASDLVVLSGCDTALGRAFRGEGLVGLTRGFLHAGASRVIASLWRVDDRATAALMAHLYRGLLRDHLGPGHALRSAQLTLQAEPQFAAPYYWAAFELSGDWR